MLFTDVSTELVSKVTAYEEPMYGIDCVDPKEMLSLVKKDCEGISVQVGQ